MFHNNIRFYGEEVLAPRPTPKLEEHPLSAVRECLFNTFAATLHIAGRSSIRNLRTRHTVVIGTHLSRNVMKNIIANQGDRTGRETERHLRKELYKFWGEGAGWGGGTGGVIRALPCKASTCAALTLMTTHKS